ncbi:MAG: dTDP-4-dehydrorhamnose reductase [Kiritimatiellae bacterium]|nr:dTDP-4-dehydrorhamnose reductase [Kiritimatiellia bacterium]
MKILITGARGMLGTTLQQHLHQHELLATDLPELDITDPAKVDGVMQRFVPDLVVHTAAATNVDGCEADPDTAMRVNALGSAIVAAAAGRINARLIALSTDYVFDGSAAHAYHEFDTPAPRSVYGISKLAGETAVRAHCPDHTIVRTAWLYGASGPSFLHTMLKLGSQAGPALKVVHDQCGNPTSTDALASLITRLILHPIPGVIHGSCEGEATWYEFAVAIFKAYNLKRELKPCSTLEFPRPAPRPANSRLDNRVLRLAGIAPMPHWLDALASYISECKLNEERSG